MQSSSVVGLIAALAAGAAVPAPRAVETGVYLWQEESALFGGLSGIELAPDGLDFVAVSDRAAVFSGRLSRGEAGQIIAVTLKDGMPVVPVAANGAPLADEMVDAEGLALAPGGDLAVSFETQDRVVRYGPDGRGFVAEDWPAAFQDFEINAGIEALAIDAAGRLWALPEKSPDPATIPVHRLENGRWSMPMTLRRDGAWRPVGADFGADGRLYLLERDYWPLIGFMSRVRRIAFDGDRVTEDIVLFRSGAGRHGNLEGLAVWQDAAGAVRLTLISDDNFLPFQRTELVDLRVTE